MSVIHIENFPLSGNIASVREFFSGLDIPEGGVHILGGPRGDAFVVFLNPDDARRALLMNGRRIHGRPVSLLESSRETMLSYINQSNAGRGGGQPFAGANQYQHDHPPPPLVGGNFQPGGFQNQQQMQAPGNDRYGFQQHQQQQQPQGQGFSGGPGSGQGFDGRGFAPGPDFNQSQQGNNSSSNFPNNSQGFDGSNHGNGGYNRPSRFEPVQQQNTGYNRQQNQQHGSQQHGNQSDSYGNQRRNNRGNSPGRDRSSHGGTDYRRGVGDTLRRIQEDPSHSRGRKEERSLMDENPFSCCVFVSNFPVYMTNGDIRNKYFGDCKFASGGLKIIYDAHAGQKNAYMKFRSPGDTAAALNRHGRQIDNKQINVRTCSEKEFTDAVENYIPPKTDDKKPRIEVNLRTGIIGPRPTRGKGESKSTDPGTCVVASNMPNDVTVRDMTLLFFDSNIVDDGVKIMYDKSGKGTGKAYIKLKSKLDAERALKRSGANIDSCRVVVSKCSLESYQSAIQLARKSGSDVSADVYVLVSNLPSDVTHRDINLFFHHSKLASDGIFIRRDSRRKGPAEAYLKFLSPVDLQRALSRNGDFIEGSRINVQRCPQQEYNQAVGINNTGMKTPTLCAMVSNLPSDIRPRDITLFFHSSAVAHDGIKVIHDDRGKATGTVYVKFKSPKDIENALKQHGATLENKKVMVKRCPHEDFARAVEHPKGDRRDRNLASSSDRNQSASRNDRNRNDPPRKDMKRVSLYAMVTNLPRDITARDLNLFFQGVRVARNGFKIPADRHGNSLGKAFVKFDSEKDAKAGLGKHQRKIDNFSISVKECSWEDFDRANDNYNQQTMERASPGQLSQPPVQIQPGPFPTQIMQPIGMGGGDMDLRPPPPKCVYVSNIPQDCNYRHVQDFFVNCHIVPNGIKLRLSRDTPGLKEAYVRFMDEVDVMQALQHHGENIGPMLISVKICSNEEFENADILMRANVQEFQQESISPMFAVRPILNDNMSGLIPMGHTAASMPMMMSMDQPLMTQSGPLLNDVLHTHHLPLVIATDTNRDTRIVQERIDHNAFIGHKRAAGSSTHGDQPRAKRGRDMDVFCAVIRNLQFAATARDIEQFLKPATIIAGPVLYFKPNGLNTGKSEIQFPSQHDLDLAMQKNRQNLLGRNVTILPISHKDFQEAFDKMNEQIRSAGAEPLPDVISVSPPDTCSVIENLPDYTEERHLRELFRQSNITQGGIHIFYYGSGKATGVGYVEFTSGKDQERAIKSNNRKVGSKAVSVQSVSKAEMEHRLNVRRKNLGLIGTSIPSVTTDTREVRHASQGNRRDDRGRSFEESNPQQRFGNNFQHPQQGGQGGGDMDDFNDQGTELDYYEEDYPNEIAPAEQRFQSNSQPRGVSGERRENRTSRSPRQSRPPRDRRSPAGNRGNRDSRSNNSRAPGHSHRSPTRRSTGNDSRRDGPNRSGTNRDESRNRPRDRTSASSQSNGDPVFIHIQNLSEDVQMEDLVEFMRSFNVFPEMIELQCIEDSMKEEGIAMFKNSSDAHKAVKAINNKKFRRRNVEVFIGSHSDISGAIP